LTLQVKSRNYNDVAFQDEGKLTNTNTSLPQIFDGLSAEARAAKLAAMIDHTLLKPDATESDLKKVCDEALTYGFATVCVNSSRVAFVAQLLAGSKTLPISVVGFPLGAAATNSKAFETKQSVQDGAREIDMVINIGALREKNYSFVENDIRAVVEAAKPYPVKVILETSTLSEAEKAKACELSVKAGAHFVKTSTGFGSGGATVDDIKLMRQTVGPNIGVKASGGIRTLSDAIKMINAGANRLGASASVAIIKALSGPEMSGASGAGNSGY
jgi:deoxyribose-phosphate aldolase